MDMNFATRYFKIRGEPQEQVSRVNAFVALCKQSGVTPDNLDYFKTYAILAITGMTDALDTVLNRESEHLEEMQLGSQDWLAHFQITRVLGVAVRTFTSPSAELYREVANIIEQKLNVKLDAEKQDGVFRTLANSRSLMATRALLKRELNVDDTGNFFHSGKKFQISVYQPM
ncbi:hypothetical protein EVC12_164 [Rhizobium phage RHph_I42]|nr:hypothetical protein EVC12_164 [Rhizobium phage RHph_I42]